MLQVRIQLRLSLFNERAEERGEVRGIRKRGRQIQLAHGNSDRRCWEYPGGRCEEQSPASESTVFQNHGSFASETVFNLLQIVLLQIASLRRRLLGFWLGFDHEVVPCAYDFVCVFRTFSWRNLNGLLQARHHVISGIFLCDIFLRGS